MKNSLDRVDGAILKIFTKISHRFQRLTGKTNFFLAKCCMMINAIIILMYILNYWFPLLSFKTPMFSTLVNVVVTALMFLIMSDCDTANNAALCEKKAKVNFGLFDYLVTRLFLFINLFTVPWEIQHALSVPQGIIVCNILAATSAIWWYMFAYFIAVHPLPPAKSKIREWIESFAAGFAKPIPIRVEKE